MKLLLTGSNGFVGRYFINKYSDKYDIQPFSFRNDDFDSLHVEGIDVIIHLSALVHQMDGASKEAYEKVNITQTLDLAKKAKMSGVKQFIFMSTVKVYGEETDTAYTESSTCNPQDEYGKSKLKAELELKKLQNDNFTVSIIRIPIVYGYGVKANIKNLVNLVSRVPVLPFANIQNRRSMIYIGNLCYFIDKIIEQEKNGIYLLSDDKPISTTKLIKLIAKNLDKKIYLVKIPFFESLLKAVKPSFHKRLYGSLEIENSQTLKKLFGKNEVKLPYAAKEGIRIMIKGEHD